MKEKKLLVLFISFSHCLKIDSIHTNTLTHSFAHTKFILTNDFQLRLYIFLLCYVMLFSIDDMYKSADFVNFLTHTQHRDANYLLVLWLAGWLTI